MYVTVGYRADWNGEGSRRVRKRRDGRDGRDGREGRRGEGGKEGLTCMLILSFVETSQNCMWFIIANNFPSSGVTSGHPSTVHQVLINGEDEGR